jgi:hypothetical protein
MAGAKRFASDVAHAGQETQVGSRRRQRTQLAPHEGQVEGAALTRHRVVRVEDEDSAHRSLKATPSGRDTEHRPVCMPLSLSSTGIASSPMCRGVLANCSSGNARKPRRRRRERPAVPHAVHGWLGRTSDSQRCPFIVLRHMWHTRWALNKPLNTLTMPGWNGHCPSYGKAVSRRR